MENLAQMITIEDAIRVYQEKGICCVAHNGEIEVEDECEDYCEE